MSVGNLYLRKQEQKALLTKALETNRYPLAPARIVRHLVQWLRRPEARISELSPWIREKLDAEPVHGLLATVETEAKYAGYITQQQRQIDRLRDSELRRIPVEFSNFSEIPGLSTEAKQKLDRVRPETLGQAGRIPGITPAAIAVLDIYLSLGAHA